MDISKQALAFKKRINKRFLKIATDQQSCDTVIGDLKHGDNLYAFTSGQFSIINIIENILRIAGKADLKVMTWSAGIADLTYAKRFLENDKINSIKFLIDFSFPTRQPAYCQEILRLFPNSVKCTNLHAKMFLIRNEKWNFTIRTSMNLNQNKRFENFEITEGKEMADFHQNIFDTIWKQAKSLERRLSASEYKKTDDIVFNNNMHEDLLGFSSNDFNVEI